MHCRPSNDAEVEKQKQSEHASTTTIESMNLRSRSHDCLSAYYKFSITNKIGTVKMRNFQREFDLNRFPILILLHKSETNDLHFLLVVMQSVMCISVLLPVTTLFSRVLLSLIWLHHMERAVKILANRRYPL